MGSQSRSKQKRRRHFKRTEKAGVALPNKEEQQKEGQPLLNHPVLSSCVEKLQSTEWAELEEACKDICYLSLQPKHHRNLVQAKVPVRIAEILFLSSPLVDDVVRQPVEHTNKFNSCSLSICSDVVYTQLAAAETLRNLVTNSQKDEVLDLLIHADSLNNTSSIGRIDEAQTLSRQIGTIGKHFIDLLQNVYNWAKKAHQNICPEDWLLDGDEAIKDSDERLPSDSLSKEAHHNSTAAPHYSDSSQTIAAHAQHCTSSDLYRRKRRNTHTGNYLLLLGLLAEVLQLLTVCLEATVGSASDIASLNQESERLSIKELFSSPEAVRLLLKILDASVNTIWDNLRHPARYFESELSSLLSRLPEGSNDDIVINPSGKSSEFGSSNSMRDTLQRFKQAETTRLAVISSAIGDVFYALSPNNPSLASFLGEKSKCGSFEPFKGQFAITPDEQHLLNQIVDAQEVQKWWASAPESPFAVLDKTTDLDSVMRNESTRRAVMSWLNQQQIYCHLVKSTIGIQGTLVNTDSNPYNIRHILPMINAVLGKTLSMQLWHTTLPLLLSDGKHSLEEDIRASCVEIATIRMRCGLAAMRVFQTVADVICSYNPPDMDDELAFTTNPHAYLLRESGALHVFGLVLQDMLSLSQQPHRDGGNSNQDVMRHREQYLLREMTKTNAEVTTLQFLILSMEAAVWNLASLLLLMMTLTSLGDPSQLWQAIFRAVEQRYSLLNSVTHIQTNEHSTEDHLLSLTITAESLSARQLLWLQLESLVQILWTLQRKQAKAQGGVLYSTNELNVRKCEVDILIRLAWERCESQEEGDNRELSQLMPTLAQACVGTVGLLCASLKEVDAILIGCRFELEILTSYGSYNTSATSFLSHIPLVELGHAIVLSGTKTFTGNLERRAWLQDLFLVDSIVSVRAEAANSLMDFFLDEKYDKKIYAPQKIQENLFSFLSQLREYMRQRMLITKFWKRSYHMAVNPEDLEEWREIEDNLVGFLAYKSQHM